MDAFEAAPAIDEIAVVMHPEWMDEAKSICEKNNWRKVTKVIPGGKERWESSWHAIKAYCYVDSSAALWLHDAARPFVSQRIIKDVCTALETHSAVTVAVPSTDTVYITQDNNLVSIPPRQSIWRAQTPQAFHLEVITRAFEDAIEKGYIASVTDDVAVIKAYQPEAPIYIVPGEEANRKITYKEDLAE